MKENKNTSPPHFESVDELADFFDAHDMGDFFESISQVPQDRVEKVVQHIYRTYR